MKNEIEIVGGGLAGLALGLALRRAGCAVTILEAGVYPRHRVCGEFICGLDPRVSDALGLAPVLAGALSHRSVAWHWRERRHRTDTLPRPARAISRHVLDQRLADRFVESGGRLITRARVGLRELRPGRVWATGRRAGDSSWLGLKTHCRGLETAADLEFHFGDGGYVGLTRVAGDFVNVCGLFRRRRGLGAGPAQTLPAYLRACGLAGVAERVAASAVPGTQAAVAAISFAPSSRDDRPLIGDAHAMIPPFTGDGMAMAFESAWLAAAPVLEYARGSLDWSTAVTAIARAHRRSFARRLRRACLLQRLLLSRPAQPVIAVIARSNLLPFGLLFRWLH